MLRSMWTKSAALAMTPEIKRKLERIVRSGQTEQRMALRARIVLGAAGGKSNNALAKELETSRSTVIDWRQRFAEGGVAALNPDRPRGRSFKPLARAQEAAIITRTARHANGVAAAWPKSAASAKRRCSASGMPTA